MASRSEERAGRRDLVVLTADANMEYTLKGLLSRPQALGIRPIDVSVFRHPDRDPGVFLRAPEFLSPFRERHHHALALLDREGSGRGDMPREEMETDLEKRLAEQWGDRCAALVFDPELEVWLWSDSPEVDQALGWKDRKPELRDWLREAGYLDAGQSKPQRPKEAAEKALRIARKPRSSDLYRQLAQKVSVRRCQDPTFERFCQVLRDWFPAEPPH